MTVPAPADNAQQAPNIAFNLGAIMLVLLFCGVGAGYLIDAQSRVAAPRSHGLDDGRTLTRTLGGRDLEIPQAWFRYEEQRVDGFAKQIDLRLNLALGPEGKAQDVDITLLPRSGVRSSARLLDGVYVHMFGDAELPGPPGLMGKPLKAAEGYGGETVWYDPLSSDPFVAKCSAPIREGGESQCLRMVHLAPGIAAVYTFGSDLLAHWRDFDPRMRLVLERIGVFGG